MRMIMNKLRGGSSASGRRGRTAGRRRPARSGSSGGGIKSLVRRALR